MEKSYKFEIKAKKNEKFDSCEIKNEYDAVNYARQFYHDDINLWESFFIIMLNNANKVIGWLKVAQGGINRTQVDIRIILKACIDTLATGVILVHNHPSSSCEPSREDKALTNQIKEVLKMLDIILEDHIILSEENWKSMKQWGYINR